MAKATWDWEGRIGRRLKLRDLHILAAVVRWKSMVKAASDLAMSQSAVWEAIASLENALDVRLLDRTTRGVEPTRYADALLKRGHVVFDELRHAINDIEFLADPASGEVRIACPEYLIWLLPSVIDRLSRQYPQITVHVFQPNTATVEFREPFDRNADLLITRVPERFADDDLNVELLIKDRHMIVAGTHSAWTKKNTANGPALVSELTQALKNRCQIVPITPHGSKSSRLKRHIDKIIQGRVHLAGHRDYWAEVIEEFGAFPHGKHSDQIDAFTQMADYVEANGALAKPVPTMSEFPMAMAGNSQASGYPHLMSTADHKKPGICVGRGNSLYAPYGRSWVVR